MYKKIRKGIGQIMYRVRRSFGRMLTAISPELNTKYRYRAVLGRKWDPDNLVTLNDKITWLKLNQYNHDPKVRQLADKYRVREFLEDNGYGHLLIPLIATYEKPEDIDFTSLPEKFVLKLNVGWACNLICTDKSKLDYEEIKKLVRKWIKQDYYLTHGELQYKDVKPVILIEEYLDDGSGYSPEDYKFYCFNGSCKTVMVCLGRGLKNRAEFYQYNRNWDLLPYTRDSLRNPNVNIEKPELIDEAFVLADVLSTGFPFVRVDLYILNSKIYFGEFTFTPSAGLDAARLPEIDLLFGSYLDISDLIEEQH